MGNPKGKNLIIIKRKNHGIRSFKHPRHKLKRTVQAPNSYFMNVKSRDNNNLAVVFSHSQTPIYCPSTTQVLAKVTGGKVMLADRCSFSVKKHDKKQTM